jgi:inositol-phosphate phosphatase/L-galactose 1-phosphate phosphatase/histidinol-phosphatase
VNLPLDKTELVGMAFFIHRAADTARAIAQHFFRQQMDVNYKSDDSPVTEADETIEHAIIGLIREHYPHHGIYGEESGTFQEESEWQWVIDPIDGTRAFIAGKPTFVTLIALCYQNTPILGVIDQPIALDRWLGCMGQPTLYNGQAIMSPPSPPLNQCQIATTSHRYFNPEQEQAFTRLKVACASETEGLDGYSYGLLTKGSPEIVVDAGLKPYDFCALSPVIAGCGGIITDWSGQPLKLTSDGTALAAGNSELHNEALQWLQQSTPIIH